jgi:uncharacterized repeat protein (TIGR03803 family)
MQLPSWLRFATSALQRARSQNGVRRRSVQLGVEQLETRLTPSIALSTLASFNGTNGSSPEAGLVMDSSGNLYGTTNNGGAAGDGTVFELAHGSGTPITLASFNGTNGKNPDESGLVMDGSGNLYGTTASGGASGYGTVFELAQGSDTITTLASFNVTNGLHPSWGVIMDSSGNLYGITAGIAFGGNTDQTVFELPYNSNTHTFGSIATLASFPAYSDASGSLVVDGSGNLYGVTEYGGASNLGSIFEVAQGSGAITTLASFGANGAVPVAGPIMDGSGNLYGTTIGGGASGWGTVFELARNSSTITTLASFNGATGNPYAGLLMDSSGNLYGTTMPPNASLYGTVFELPQGSATITTLASFNGTNGSDPLAGLVMGSSGNLYGTTESGGASGDGTVFELSNGPSFAVSSFSSPITAGTAGSFTVTALNADGTVNTGYTGTVTFSSSDPQAVLPANYTFTTADQGVHTSSATLKTAGSQSITATDTTTGSVTGSDTGITVNPAATASLVFSSVPSGTTAGSAFNLTLTAKDAYGNIATGYTGTVHFTSSDAKAVLPANYTFTSSDAGQHSFSITFKKAGTQSVTATDTATSSLTATANGIVVNAAAASQFILSAPSSVTSGSKFSVTLTVEDAYGNVVTGYTGTVHFSSSDSTATLPKNYTFTASDAGVHTFTGVILRKKGKQTLTVTDIVNSALTATDTISVG